MREPCCSRGLLSPVSEFAAVPRPRAGRPPIAHAAVVAGGFTLLALWVCGQAILHGRVLAESDLFEQYLPTFLSPALTWSSFEFSGVPAYADPESGAVYPVRWLFSHSPAAWNLFVASAFVLAGAFAYAYAYFHTRSVRAALLGGVAFVLSEAVVERVVHVNILHAIAWVPLIFLSIDAMLVSRRWPAWIAAGAFAGACCILAGHPQIPLYTAYIASAYTVVALLTAPRPLANLARVATAGVAALLLAGVSLLPLAELSHYTRRQEFAFADFVSYANTPWQMLSALFPVVSHSGVEAPTYVGLLTLLLAGLALTQWRSNWRIVFWAVVSVVVLIAGAGAATPIARLAESLPLYDRFRIVSRHLVFAAFGLAMLAAFGAAALEHGRVSRRAWYTSAVAFAVLMVAGATLLARWPTAVNFDHVNEATRLPWVVDRVWFQLALAVAVIGLIAVLRRWSGSHAATAAAAIVLAGDLTYALPYAPAPGGPQLITEARTAVVPSVHARRLASRLAGSRQRFMAADGSLTSDVVPGLFARPWRMFDAGGYTSVLLADTAALSQVGSGGSVSAQSLQSADLGLDLLAVKYLIVQRDWLTPEQASALAGNSRWREVESFATSRTSDRDRDTTSSGEHDYTLFENTRALPRAWLASEVLPVTDGTLSDAIRTSRLRGGRDFVAARTALVDEGVLPATQYPDGGTATVRSIEDSEIRVDVTSPGGGFLVLSEAHYPGWRARIDDAAPVPVYRTDLALQGVPVPAGTHRVTFAFVPEARRRGLLFSAAGVVLMCACAVAGWRSPWS